MDSYRAISAQLDPLASDAQGDDGASGDDEIGHEAPPVSVGQDERRMQVRAYNYWASLLGDRNFPRIDDMASAKMPDFAKNAVVLDFSDGIENPVVTMLGEKLAEECGATKTIRRLDDVPGRSLLSRITDHYMQILANQAPIGFEAEFVNLRGKTVVYRGILLPFSSDEEKIQHIMGVINWKELADPGLTAGLIQELDHAIGEEHVAPGMPLVEWADGPAVAEPTDDAASFGIDRPEWNLPQWLASARELAQAASGSEDRSRAALYVAIGRAWDLALEAQAQPAVFAAIVANAGLRMQARAPMTALVKLVFGPEYDKTRLAEFAAALRHARRQGLERGKLADYLAGTPGGLKGVVAQERKLRRKEKRGHESLQCAHERSADRLRALPTINWEDISMAGSEFAMLLIRQMADGNLRVLGKIT